MEVRAKVHEHHSFTVEQYGKAIKEMRELLTLRKSDLRTTLLGSLLIICFESLHGIHESSIAHIQAGVNLVEEWFRDIASRKSLS